jgi:hypothetical protein
LNAFATPSLNGSAVASVTFWGDRRKLLGLVGQCLKLLARMFRRKFYERRRRRRAEQLLDKVEASVSVRLSEFDELVVLRLI